MVSLPMMSTAATAPRSRASRGEIRAYQIGNQQGLESLSLVKRPEPVPGPGEVVVSVRAAALNNRDLSILRGRYLGTQPIERIPLADGAGDVIAVGEGVSRVKVGDRVTAVPFSSWVDGEFEPSVFAADLGNGRDGWLTEKALLPATSLVKLSDAISYEDAAAIAAVGVTAWSIIHVLGAVKPGDIVLTLGTGGLSMMAVQIAKMAGARAAITSSSDEKLSAAKARGADITVNYRTHPEWGAKIIEATDGRGADIVVETVGASTLSQTLVACAPNARVGFVGSLGGPATAAPNLGPLIRKNVLVKGLTGGPRRALERLHRAVESSGMRPVIDKTFSFDDAPAAFAHLATGDHMGKVVIRF
jgi:NADPH:quinone reductase-like Zn-dependent oxidoreductase